MKIFAFPLHCGREDPSFPSKNPSLSFSGGAGRVPFFLAILFCPKPFVRAPSSGLRERLGYLFLTNRLRLRTRNPLPLLVGDGTLPIVLAVDTLSFFSARTRELSFFPDRESGRLLSRYRLLFFLSSRADECRCPPPFLGAPRETTFPCRSAELGHRDSFFSFLSVTSTLFLSILPSPLPRAPPR